jgi:hypothetical protein
MANTKKKKAGLFDSRVTLRGDRADRLFEKLEEKRKAENRPTINNTISAVLLSHFEIAE